MQLKNLNTKFLGRNCIYFDFIDSTQKEAWRLIESYHKNILSNNEIFDTKKDNFNGTIIIATTQTNGIGTHGRVWYTDETNDITLSLLLNLDCHISKLENITIKIAEILVDIFKEKYNINLNIKNPNDLVFNKKKIGGILVQTKVKIEKVKWMVVGIGINTNTEYFREEISSIATSIRKEFHIQVDNTYIITEFCNRFEQEIQKRI